MNKNEDLLVTEETDENENKKGKKKQPLAELLHEVVEMMVIATATVILLFTFVTRIAVVDGPSMLQTLHHGDTLIVSDLGYEPKQGDIIVAQKLSSEWKTPIVKRVIAVGGQTVDIDFSKWTVTVDGEVIDESSYLYLARDAIITTNLNFPVTVPEGQLFVMGDNRNHSSDSRDYRIGFIDERCVFGRVLARIMPTFKTFERIQIN